MSGDGVFLRWRGPSLFGCRYDGYRRAAGSGNMIQAQRDFFGAHTYERVDEPRGQFFHTNWTGRGGTTSASTYHV